jgi:hypothetical protein
MFYAVYKVDRSDAHPSPLKIVRLLPGVQGGLAMRRTGISAGQSPELVSRMRGSAACSPTGPATYGVLRTEEWSVGCAHVCDPSCNDGER